ncbi:carboxypeptidase-like regulatory domain-containing protein [Marivirga arenosa]|uniref:Carboxypeptidase-like regulatory domain-containing protein n=1 Tax=Marivirga arenosa TaxID=3059076 RepID=A0AA51N735_9BACT|nr:carboxypeptidase-like regulatory domain-containing protein [Marivirga sp. ABR2-2]WMN07467.1 carboxypeptidase-like regulatory domain-containing protein [Marivirga sp. ABR2-2]
MKTFIHLILITGLLIFSFSTSAQEKDYYQLKGRVIDSLNQSIPYANVLLKDTTTNAIKAFAVTDEEGRFKMTIQMEQPYELRASFVGFVPFIRNIVTDPSKVQDILIQLSQDEGLLNEVQVVKEMPVTMSGDTLIYKTEAFTTGKERKLEDVLKELPGVEVDEDGSVKVQGKRVDKLLVEGKQFFDGDSKMAIKNLPAKAIDRVQVLKNYQDNSTLRNVNTNENLAMNITLKEDQKSLVFGDVSLGGGPKNSYAGHANAFYYSDDLSVNAILDANNIGKQAFNYNDFQRMRQAQNPWGIQSGALKIEDQNNGNAIPQKDRTQVQSLRSAFTGLNIAFQPSKKWQHQAYLIANNAEVDEKQIQQRRFLSEQAPEPENSESNQIQNYGNVLGQYQVDYVPSPFSNWQYKSQWLGNRISGNQNIKSSWADGQLSDIVNDSDEWSWNQQLNYYTQISPDHIFSIENQFLWRNENGQNEWDLLYGLNSEQDSSIFREEFSQKNTKTLQSELHYYWIWNNKNHLDLSMSYQYQSTDFNQNLFDEENLDLVDYKIDNSRVWSNSAVGAQWKSRVGSFLFLPGVSYFYLNDQRDALNNGENNDRISNHYVLPNFRVKYDINSVQGLNLVYKQNVRSPQIEWLSNAIQLRSYQNIFSGDTNLQPAFYNMLELNYHFFNLFNGMNAFFRASYNQVQYSFQEATDFNGLINNSSLINSGEPQNDAQYSGRLDKRFKSFRLTYESNGMYQEYANQVNGELLDNEQWSLNNSLAFQTNLGKHITSSIKYSLQNNEYTNGDSQNEFNLQRFTNKWESKWSDNFEFDFEIEYQIYAGTNTNSDWWIANSELSYEIPNSAFRLDAQVYNLLDTKSVNRDYLSEYFVSTYQNFIQGRRMMFSVNYNF